MARAAIGRLGMSAAVAAAAVCCVVAPGHALRVSLRAAGSGTGAVPPIGDDAKAQHELLDACKQWNWTEARRRLDSRLELEGRKKGKPTGPAGEYSLGVGLCVGH